ncbi:peptide ABC transporter substrate-binding protein [filamentous cyanobacterium CCP2]|nr:peptide ABC transporter substrate-binding protein [filamentous cyanobacterium CCP2]
MHPKQRRWFNLFLAGIFTFLGAISLAACSESWLHTRSEPPLVFSVITEPKTFNYVLSNEASNIFSYTYEGLTTEDGLTGETIPALAESWEISSDGLQITFTLREDLQWSDGEPLTVDDVVFTYNQLYFNEAIPTAIRDIMRIGESGALPVVEKIDDRRVTFTIPEPFAPFLRNTGLAILPAHALQESVETTDAQGNPRFLSKWGSDTNPADIICNGPYTVASYAPGQRVIFQRNPYYWRKDDAGNPQPYIQELVWQVVESTDNALIQFRSGGLDIIGVTPDYFSLMKREEERGEFTIYNGGPASGTTYLTFNLNQGSRNGTPLVDPVKSRWFNQVAFRQAVAYAIDRDRMVKNIFRGLGEPQNSPISVQSPFHLTPEEGLPVYDHNPEKAKELLLSAGFQYNALDQLLDADGNRVRFTMITNSGNETRRAMGEQIVTDLRQIGIQVDFLTQAFNTVVSKLSNSLDWEACVLGFTGGIEPNSGANVWLPNGRSHHFNKAPQPGDEPIEGRVVSEWEEEIGRLYIQAARILDEDQRKAIYAQTQTITQENLPFIYLVNPLSLSAVRDRIQPIKFSALSGALWNLHELRIEEDAA